MRQISCGIISIGNEILLGKTLNSNLAYLAGKLANLGVPVLYNVTVRDIEQDILEALDYCIKRFDIVISTGGLGPTDDDITKQTIAKYFGKELEHHQDIWLHVQSLFAKRGMKAPLINKNQALVPRDFEALENQTGTAPGLYYQYKDKCFFACAGVPVEMAYIFDTHIAAIIRNKNPQLEELIQHTIHTFGISESALAEILDTSTLPGGLNFAWLPQTGRVDLRVYGHDKNKIFSYAKELVAKIPQYVWGLDEDTPASLLGNLLRDNGLRLSLAESCTGGLIAKMLSDVPGSSDYLLGGVVSYHNDIKHNVLGVGADTLEKHGAVSQETALEMVRGIKSLTGSQCAISVTGIAGPTGGSVEKPVGTVWFGFSYLAETWTQHHVLTGSRESIRFKASELAILTMAKKIKEHSQ